MNANNPTIGEVRRYLNGIGWNLPAHGGLPRKAYEKWNEDHPERPYPIKSLSDSWEVRSERARNHAIELRRRQNERTEG